MKDLNDKQLIEIINSEFETFMNNAMSSLDKALADVNNIPIEEFDEHTFDPIGAKQLPTFCDGYALLCNTEEFLRDMIKACIK